MTEYPILDSLGIEVETDLVNSNDVCDGIGRFSVHSDASIQTPYYYLSGIHCKKDGVFQSLIRGAPVKSFTAGVEFVSDVLERKNVRESVSVLTNFLQTYGEPLTSVRSGIHVHVGMAYDLKILKKILKMSLWTESLLFHLAGMGYEFRGSTNNSAFCRPWSSPYQPPVIFNIKRDMHQLCNVNALLNADSLESFWDLFGGVQPRELNRYTPQRYMGVNIYSILLKGTIEYRFFNKTLNPDYIWAITELCSELTRRTWEGGIPSNEINSVYEPPDIDGHHKIISLVTKNLPYEVGQILHEILDKTPPVQLEPKYILTHLKPDAYRIFIEDAENSRVLPSPKEVRYAERSGVIDIHFLNNELERTPTTEFLIRKEGLVPTSFPKDCSDNKSLQEKLKLENNEVLDMRARELRNRVRNHIKGFQDFRDRMMNEIPNNLPLDEILDEVFVEERVDPGVEEDDDLDIEIDPDFEEEEENDVG